MYDKIHQSINTLMELMSTALNIQKWLAILTFILLILLMLVKLYQRISIELYFKKHPEEDPFNFDKKH